MLLPLAILAAFLPSLVGTASVKEALMAYSSPREFYHDLTKDKQEWMLLNADLEDPEQFQVLIHLLADETFNISGLYNQICGSMSYGRAIAILNLFVLDKELERLLLGPACLSPDTIKARKDSNMWPPFGLPLLVSDLKTEKLNTADIKRILNVALTQPRSWQSASWAYSVEWDKMDDLRFWRMIPPGNYPPSHFLAYMIRCLEQRSSSTPQDLEELLMKSTRLSSWCDESRRALKKSFDVHALLSNFTHLRDQWSLRVLSLLKQMQLKDWNLSYFDEALLDSKLLQLTSWQGTSVHKTTNDIFELFTVAFTIRPIPSQVIKQAFGAFLDAISDWSCVRPLVLRHVVFRSEHHKFLDYATLGKYVDRMLKNPNTISTLPTELLEHSKNLKAHQNLIKMWTQPLMHIFAHKVGNPCYLSPYMALLYQEWARNKTNWPGMMIVHEKIKDSLRIVFKDGTGDPKTDRDYSIYTWDLAFDTIRFDIQHGIPNTPIPSKCFLQALVYCHKVGPWHTRSIDWSELIKKVDSECTFPKERGRYELALNAADRIFFQILPTLPRVNAELLRALIHRNTTKMESIEELTSNMLDLTLN